MFSIYSEQEIYTEKKCGIVVTLPTIYAISSKCMCVARLSICKLCETSKKTACRNESRAPGVMYFVANILREKNCSECLKHFTKDIPCLVILTPLIKAFISHGFIFQWQKSTENSYERGYFYDASF